MRSCSIAHCYDELLHGVGSRIVMMMCCSVFWRAVRCYLELPELLNHDCCDEPLQMNALGMMSQLSPFRAGQRSFVRMRNSKFHNSSSAFPIWAGTSIMGRTHANRMNSIHARNFNR